MKSHFNQHLFQDTVSQHMSAQIAAIDSEGYVSAHNSRRVRHCVPELKWDDDLAASAQAHADGCEKKKSGTADVGENLFLAKGFVYGPEAVLDAWYKTEGSDAFNQVVWKDTTKVGCGEVTDCEIGHLVVCHYSPAGNIEDQVSDQVLATCV
eukprot:TRINITY_DN2853_c0_g1_i2.p1 TRINITY_DN2853_c0_g1~~TRINITY_DN2853_c0_g1_i2.p1  ORF type:complete len:152 (+),score=28.61 TRINITY_DN2853_c0_g1_i2:3-458(+)